MITARDVLEAFDIELPSAEIEVIELGVAEPSGFVQSPAIADAASDAVAFDTADVDAASRDAGAADADVQESAAPESAASEAAVTEAAATNTAATNTAAALSDTVRIGSREISRQLYQIFLSEAEDLLATLVDDARATRQPATG